MSRAWEQSPEQRPSEKALEGSKRCSDIPTPIDDPSQSTIAHDALPEAHEAHEVQASNARVARIIRNSGEAIVSDASYSLSTAASILRSTYTPGPDGALLASEVASLAHSLSCRSFDLSDSSLDLLLELQAGASHLQRQCEHVWRFEPLRALIQQNAVVSALRKGRSRLLESFDRLAADEDSLDDDTRAFCVDVVERLSSVPILNASIACSALESIGQKGPNNTSTALSALTQASIGQVSDSDQQWLLHHSTDEMLDAVAEGLLPCASDIIKAAVEPNRQYHAPFVHVHRALECFANLQAILPCRINSILSADQELLQGLLYLVREETQDDFAATASPSLRLFKTYVEEAGSSGHRVQHFAQLDGIVDALCSSARRSRCDASREASLSLLNTLTRQDVNSIRRKVFVKAIPDVFMDSLQDVPSESESNIPYLATLLLFHLTADAYEESDDNIRSRVETVMNDPKLINALVDLLGEQRTTNERGAALSVLHNLKGGFSEVQYHEHLHKMLEHPLLVESTLHCLETHDEDLFQIAGNFFLTTAVQGMPGEQMLKRALQTHVQTEELWRILDAALSNAGGGEHDELACMLRRVLLVA